MNQGDVIMEADDTGKSFHSHLHLDVVMDTSGRVVAAGAANARAPPAFRSYSARCVARVAR